MAAACFFTIETFLTRNTGTEEKHSASAHMSTAYAVDHKGLFTLQIRYHFLRSRPTRNVNRVIRPLVRSFRRDTSPDSMLRFSLGWVHRREGRRRGRGGLRSPVPRSQLGTGDFYASGVTRWQFDLRGMRSGLCANPFPIRIVQINYCALSSAADSCRSACRAARLASFSAACSCRHLLSWRLPFRPSKYRRESGDLRPETAFYLYLFDIRHISFRSQFSERRVSDSFVVCALAAFLVLASARRWFPLFVALFSDAISFGAFLLIKLFLPLVFLIVMQITLRSRETLQRCSGALFNYIFYPALPIKAISRAAAHLEPPAAAAIAAFCALFSRFLLPSVGFFFFLSSFFVLYMLF